ncbi:MAG TPA: hypothetical protein PK530_24155 [Anaerolineales bacterium]|nr:hypothetical protein [Anaerolineales bacterium]
MKKQTLLFIVPILVLVALTSGLILKRQLAPPAEAAPTVLAGSLQAGCYLITTTACRLSVEPFVIKIAENERLISFNLTANNQILYDFGASAANPVTGQYMPAPPAWDFAAQCGDSYTLRLNAKDTGDLTFLNLGQTQPITCPSATYLLYIPITSR